VLAELGRIAQTVSDAEAFEQALVQMRAVVPRNATLFLFSRQTVPEEAATVGSRVDLIGHVRFGPGRASRRGWRSRSQLS
jgi:hypothetical protein